MEFTEENDLPNQVGKKAKVTVEPTTVVEIDGFRDRVSRVEKVLRLLANDPEPGTVNAIPISFTAPQIARQLAMIWENRNGQSKDKFVVGKVQKLQELARLLMDHHFDKMTISGISLDMKKAIIGVANSEVFAERSKPKRGGTTNKSAVQLAIEFARHYTRLTGRPLGVTADHDFVVTLGEVFVALNFKARPRHYAGLAVDALALEMVAKRTRATDLERQGRPLPAPPEE